MIKDETGRTFSSWEDFKQTIIYPAIVADEASVNAVFEGMNFHRAAGGYLSPFHIDGTRSKDGEGTHLYTNNYLLKDYSRGNKGLLDLYLEQSGLSFSEGIKKLSEILNFAPIAVSPEVQAQATEYERKQRLRGWINTQFVEDLWSGKEEANRVLEYLRGRGWTDEEIKKVEIGFCGAAAKKNFSTSEKTKEVGQELLSSVTDEGDRRRYIGENFTLSIPYRSAGRVLGWNFRDIDATGNSVRYCTSASKDIDLNMKRGLQGLRANNGDRLVIVEGDLDALHAQVRGFGAIAATMGGPVTQTHAQDAIKKGYRNFILLFDNDERGRGFVEKSISTIEKEGGKVFVSYLPEGVKDTDQYLSTRSVKEWAQDVETNSYPASVNRLFRLMENYQGRESFSFVERSNLIEALRSLIYTTDPTDRALLKTYLVEYAQTLNTNRADLEEIFEVALQSQQEKKKQEELTSTTDKLQELLKGGRLGEAEELLQKTSQALKDHRSINRYAEDFAPFLSLNALRNELAQQKDGLPTGIVFRGDSTQNVLTWKTGISLVCGAQGHRKTSFLLNMALNEATRNLQAGNGKKVLFLTYEMDRKMIITSLINIYLDNDNIGRNSYESIRNFLRTGENITYYEEERDSQGRVTRKIPHSLEAEINLFLQKYIVSDALKVVYTDYKVGDLLGALRYYKQTAKGELSLVCVDYAQQIYSENYSRQRTEEIKEVVNRIKDYAVQEELAVLMGAQFNRTIESPRDVNTSAIGEAGDLERIAVDCIGLYNLRKYTPSKTSTSWTSSDPVINLPIIRNGETNREELATKVVADLESPVGYTSGVLYAKLLKSRFGDYPLDTLLEIHEKTGKIVVSDPHLLKEEGPQMGDLFEEQTPPPAVTAEVSFRVEGLEDTDLPF